MGVREMEGPRNAAPFRAQPPARIGPETPPFTERRLTPSERWNRALGPLFGCSLRSRCEHLRSLGGDGSQQRLPERAVLTVDGPLGTTPGSSSELLDFDRWLT
jgi:hypothetical protein